MDVGIRNNLGSFSYRLSFVIILVFVSMSFSVSGLCQGLINSSTSALDSIERAKVKLFEERLQHAFSTGSYSWGVKFADSLILRKDISPETMVNCAKCYLEAKDYKKAYDYCLQNLAKANTLGIGGIFRLFIGETYYYQGSYKDAERHFEEYISWAQENNMLDTQPLGEYADILYKLWKYDQAEHFFDEYFKSVSRTEGVSIDRLNGCTKAKTYGEVFYNRAYNAILSGNEVRGKEYLELAEKCGNQKAKADLKVLSNTITFATSPKIKAGIRGEFKAHLNEFDLPELNAGTTINTASAFWEYVRTHSRPHEKVIKQREKKKPSDTFIQAVSTVYGYAEPNNRYIASLTLDNQDELIRGLKRQLYGNQYESLIVYLDPDFNAFMMPDGRLGITTNLVNRYHGNPSLLIGVCAHEATHYYCEHTLESLWQVAVKEKRSKIAGEVSGGIYAVIMAAAGIAGAANGVDYGDDYWKSIPQTTIALTHAFDEDAFLFQFKHSRSQEIESDIIAYRFCEWLGVGGYAYIVALELIGDNDAYIKRYATDDHPTIPYRVMLLKSLYEQEHGSNN